MPTAAICQKGKINPIKLLEQFKDTIGKEAGAIGSFLGVVRGESKTGKKVRGLHFERSEQAEVKLKEIASDAEKTDGILDVAIYHVVDDLKPGEYILCVLVGGKHRKEVFEVLPRIVDRIKTEPQIWKKEITENREYWIRETEQ